MPIYRLGEFVPRIDPTAYVADSADVIGRVTLQRDTSLWSHVSIRADNDDIVIGAGTNIQEGSVLHVDVGTPMHIAERVTVGHQAMLHGCTVGENSLIGMQAIILNRAVIGRNVLVAAGALIPEGKVIPDNVLVMGIGKIQRELTEDEILGLQRSTQTYIERARLFKSQLQRL